MPLFRKRPVTVHAWHTSYLLDAARNNWAALPTPIAEAYERGDVLFLTQPPSISIQTLEGTLTAPNDSFIIQGAQGELYPCARDIFLATYEPVLPDVILPPTEPCGLCRNASSPVDITGAM
jgi:hypothetical protein